MHHGNDEEESCFDCNDNNVTKVGENKDNGKNENQAEGDCSLFNNTSKFSTKKTKLKQFWGA